MHERLGTSEAANIELQHELAEARSASYEHALDLEEGRIRLLEEARSETEAVQMELALVPYVYL